MVRYCWGSYILLYGNNKKGEISMKQRLLLLVFITLLILVFSAPLLAQPEDEEEEGPIQAWPNPIAWSKFNKLTRISSLAISMHRGNRLAIGMRGIRSALEKAGISEPVKIFINTGRGQIKLGLFNPTVLYRKRPGRVKRSPLRSSYFVQFRGIRGRHMFSHPAVKGGGSIAGPATLIFKNKMGQTKASFRTNIVLK
jgi:hypothetical protein